MSLGRDLDLGLLSCLHKGLVRPGGVSLVEVDVSVSVAVQKGRARVNLGHGYGVPHDIRLGADQGQSDYRTRITLFAWALCNPYYRRYGVQ